MSRILIVEDEASIASVIQDYLAQRGYEIDVVTNGVEALDRVLQQRPSLILMDLMMPRLNGGETARILKGQPETAPIPIIAISGVENPHEFADVLAVDAVIAKPFDLDDLGATVDALLSGEPANGTLAQTPETVSQETDSL